MENAQRQSPDRPASHQGFGHEAVKQLGGAQAQDTGPEDGHPSDLLLLIPGDLGEVIFSLSAFISPPGK